jgi:hypothetical protein
MQNCPQAGKWAISVWDGPSGTDTGQALATCGAGAVSAAYYIDPNTQGWLRWFAGRPEVTNLNTVNDKQGVIALGASGAPPPASTPTTTPAATPTPTPTEQPLPPGGGTWGILTADLGVTGLNADTLPQGKVWVTIANDGPDSLANIDVQLLCSGTGYAHQGGTISVVTEPQTISVSLDPGWSNTFDTTISVDTTQYTYELVCSIQVDFNDPNPANDSHTAWIMP